MVDNSGMSTKQKIQSLALLLFMVFINVFFVIFGANIGGKGRIKELEEECGRLEDALYVKDAESDAEFEAMKNRQDALEKENKELKERVEKLE